MTGRGTLRRISSVELGKRLIQVQKEGNRELVLLGPDFSLSPTPQDWPDELKGRSILQLTEYVAGLAQKLLELNQLQSLILCNNSIGDAGAKVIAENLAQLTRLELKENSQLTSIAAISNLSMLRDLNIASTSVTDLSLLKGLITRGLPVKWDDYSSGPGIHVEDCPLVHPTPEGTRRATRRFSTIFARSKLKALTIFLKQKC